MYTYVYIYMYTSTYICTYSQIDICIDVYSYMGNHIYMLLYQLTRSENSMYNNSKLTRGIHIA